MTPLTLVPPPEELHLVCSWCNRILRNVPGAPTSHCLCVWCSIRLLEEDRSPT